MKAIKATPLLLAISLATAITIIGSSQSASAACAPRDHRTNCDSTPRAPNPNKSDAPVIAGTHYWGKKGGGTISCIETKNHHYPGACPRPRL